MNQTRKTALLTGVTSGLGKVIAKELIKRNYIVYFLARSTQKANALIEQIKHSSPNASIQYIECDLCSFDSMNNACKEIKKTVSHIDLLIQNAGIMNFEALRSKDGIEQTLQVNLLAPIFLFLNLKELISAKGNNKIMFTASALHQGTIQFNDLEFQEKFSSLNTYRQSKLGIILMTRLLASLPEYNVYNFYAVHPGIVKTELGRNAGWFSKIIFNLMGTSLEKGAKTHVSLIDKPIDSLKNGEYYANSKVKKTTKESYDLQEAQKLFELIKDYIKPYL